MLGRTHEILSVASAVAVGQAVTLPTLDHATLAGSAYMAARLPDVDMKLGIRHRGVTHWLLTTVVLTVLLAAGLEAFGVGEWVPVIAAGFAIGYGMHCVADAMTVSGVPLLAPLYARDVWLLPRGLRFRTGSVAESVLGVLVVLVTGGWVYAANGGGLG